MIVSVSTVVPLTWRLNCPACIRDDTDGLTFIDSDIGIRLVEVGRLRNRGGDIVNDQRELLAPHSRRVKSIVDGVESERTRRAAGRPGWTRNRPSQRAVSILQMSHRLSVCQPGCCRWHRPRSCRTLRPTTSSPTGSAWLYRVAPDDVRQFGRGQHAIPDTYIVNLAIEPFIRTCPRTNRITTRCRLACRGIGEGAGQWLGFLKKTSTVLAEFIVMAICVH